MKRALLVGLGLAAIMAAESAKAADLSVAPLATKAAPPPGVNWSGCYIGPQIGGLADFSVFSNGLGVGVIAGGQIGCNYQTGAVLIGIEGEGVWSGTNVRTNTAGAGFGPGNNLFTTKNNWDADASVRMGVIWPGDALTYFKVGIASGQFSFNNTNTNTAPTFTNTGKTTLTGVLGGVGVELALTPQWFARAELDLIFYNGRDVTLTQCQIGCQPTIQTLWQVQYAPRVGVSYKFY